MHSAGRYGADNKRTVGSIYEREAAAFLMQHGYRIREMNFRCRSGEIDLIAMDRQTLVFVEVKYRSNEQAGDPAEAVNRHKRQQICRVADFYRLRYGFSSDVCCRFDVVAILGNRIRLIQNAFPYQQ